MRYLLFMGVAFLLACNPTSEDTTVEKVKVQLSREFKDYWFAGEAEITVYDLKQSRYGQPRDGHATMIFVTENFSDTKEVKLDNPSNTPEDVVKVMKRNATRKFTTGIYPYSIMTSVFTPLHSDVLTNLEKITFSSQDWCGQSWIQINEDGKQNLLQSYSYFESAGDQIRSLEDVIMEDAIWNYLRYSPQYLPKGKHKFIPAMTFLRFTHNDIKPYEAHCMLEKSDSLSRYTVSYPDLGRELRITFATAFPHKIDSWVEVLEKDGKKYKTVASAKERMKIDYWNHNSNKDSILRKELGLQ